LARKAPPIERLVCNNPMPPGDIHHPRSRLKTPSHNPRLQVIGPAPVPAPRFDNLATPDKSIPTISHRHLHMSTKTFWQTHQTAETGEINGSETSFTMIMRVVDGKTVGPQLGIKMEGKTPFMHMASVHFRAVFFRN
jgi:hypothetical protein